VTPCLRTLAALFSAIALYATYLSSGDAKWSVYWAAGFCLCIAGWQTSSFVIGLKLRHRLKKGRESTDSISELPAQHTRSELDSGSATDFVALAIVAEGTTRILEPATKRLELTNQ
jgi:hypothetical protein